MSPANRPPRPPPAEDDPHREHLRRTFDAMGIGCWEYDMAADRLWWSEGMCALLGLAPTDAQADLAAWLARIHPTTGRHCRPASPPAATSTICNCACATQPAPKAAGTNAEDPREVIARLAQLLQSGDFGAAAMFADKLSLLRASLDGRTLARLEREIRAFDFDGALRTLQSAAPQGERP